MKTVFVSAIAALAVTAGAAFAQQGDPVAIANEAGVCGDGAVVTAVFADSGTINAVCEDDPVGFVPVGGALAGVLGALLLAGGGDGPNDTSGTSGTNGTGN